MKVISFVKKFGKKRNKDVRKGEVDRVIFNMKSKYLFFGKRFIGKTDRR